MSGHRGDEIKKLTGELMVPRKREAGAEQFIQLKEGEILKGGTDGGSK